MKMGKPKEDGKWVIPQCAPDLTQEQLEKNIKSCVKHELNRPHYPKIVIIPDWVFGIDNDE